jgi:hypothetical protein
MNVNGTSELLPVNKIVKSAETFEHDQVPTLRNLTDLALDAYFQEREFGCQISRVVQKAVETFHSIYNKGDSNSIREPDGPQNSVSGVYFHTHFQSENTWINRLKHKVFTTWYMLPSDVGVQDLSKGIGDVFAQMGTKTLGGYFNIVTPFHLTLNIGRIREINSTVSDSQWEILYGSQKGRIFSAFQRQEDKKSKPDDVMVWVHRWPGGLTNYFLVVDSTVASQYEKEIGSVKELCFGNGLNVLMDRLKLVDMPHAHNLSEITKLS